MNIIPVARDDFFELEKIESEIFQKDSFDIYLLEEYFSKNILYSKIENKESNEIIGFFIVTKYKKNDFEETFFKYFKDIRSIDQNHKKYAHLDGFVIKKNYWGKGYGKKLLKYMMDKISKMGYSYIVLEINQNNKIAQKLYESFGFKIIYFLENYYSSGSNANIMLFKNQN